MKTLFINNHVFKINICGKTAHKLKQPFLLDLI